MGGMQAEPCPIDGDNSVRCGPRKGHELAGATTHDRPQPAFVASFAHKTPGFIEFEHIIGPGGRQR